MTASRRPTVGPVPPRLALFGARRSGSSWLLQMLESYVSAREPETLLLGEYFNVGLLRNAFRTTLDERGSPLEERVELGTPGAWVFDWRNSGAGPEACRSEAPRSKAERADPVLRATSTDRMSWLEGAEKFLLKTQPWDFSYNARLTRFLSERCQVICIERKDLKSQLLSDCLSAHTGVLYVRAGTRPARPATESFACERSTIDRIAGELERYYELKAQLEPVTTFYYEDLVELRTPFRALEQLGWLDWPVRVRKAPDLVRQNPAQDYLEYFSNRHDLSGWIDDRLARLPR